MQDTEYSGLEELLNSEVMTNYNSFIVETAINYVGEVENCVDFGAGIGSLSVILRDKFNINPLCIEVDKKNIEYLNKRNFNVCKDIYLAPINSDLIFSSNVLEHIEDDISILKQMKNNLRIGGHIYLYLPAKMVLWSRLDELVGHHRRYEFDELRTKCEKVGLKVNKLYYADSIGFFASLCMKIFGYNSENGIGSVASLKFYDKYLFPISKWLDKFGLKYVFGKNLILIAEKTSM